MNRTTTGTYHDTATAGERVRAFVPLPLPPVPPLEIAGARQLLLERATLAVGRLDGISALLPDPQRFLYSHVRREAVLSSQIEVTTCSTAFAPPATGRPGSISSSKAWNSPPRAPCGAPADS